MRINLCYSGGRTSAYMVENLLLLQSRGFFPDTKFIITFANTGREHDNTLDFVNSCDLRWQKLYNNKVVWLESVVNSGRKASSHKQVSFETASRRGEPFEDVTAKYGIPNSAFLHCTRELKENPILDYMESLGEKKGHNVNRKLVEATYETFIGIRSDEAKRLKGNRNGKQKKFYPLADTFDGINLVCEKQDVLDFWEDMPFNLNIPEHLGNCIDCHKKSQKKLNMVYNDLGKEAFAFTKHLDDQYSDIKPQTLPNGSIKNRKRFRGYKNTRELIASFKLNDYNPKTYNDESGGCSESCEPFTDNGV